MRKRVKRILVCAAILLGAALAIAGGILFNIKPDIRDLALTPIANNVQVVKGQNGAPTTMQKSDRTDFKILTFTDTHLDFYTEKGYYTYKYMIATIQAQQPDLVVINGDVVTSALNRCRAVQLCEVMEKLGVYWILTLGNHEGDNAFSMSRKAFVELYASYEHCLIQSGDKKTEAGETVWGYGNTQLNLLDADGNVKQALFFLDTGADISDADAEKYGVKQGSTDYIKSSQISWYSQQASKLGAVNSILFIHQPIPQYTLAFSQEKAEDGSFSPANGEDTEILFGTQQEKVSCPKFDSGMFAAIEAGGSTKYVVCGHDHVNDFHAQYRDVTLCYNRCSGFSSYNAVTKGLSDTLQQGATVYTVDFSSGGVAIEDIRYSDLYDLTEVYKLYE